MLVKVTENMRKEIVAAVRACDACKEVQDVRLVKMRPEQYAISCGSIWENETDYSPRTGLFSALVVNYNPEAYAAPRFITTRDLNYIFRNSDKSYNGFFKAVTDALAI